MPQPVPRHGNPARAATREVARTLSGGRTNPA